MGYPYNSYPYLGKPYSYRVVGQFTLFPLFPHHEPWYSLLFLVIFPTNLIVNCLTRNRSNPAFIEVVHPYNGYPYDWSYPYGVLTESQRRDGLVWNWWCVGQMLMVDTAWQVGTA